MREKYGYVIGHHINGEPNRSQADYFAEGWLIPPTWTSRRNANRYSNKRDAIREAKKYAQFGYTTFVEPFHDPFGNIQPIWAQVKEF